MSGSAGFCRSVRMRRHDGDVRGRRGGGGGGKGGGGAGVSVCLYRGGVGWRAPGERGGDKSNAYQFCAQ